MKKHIGIIGGGAAESGKKYYRQETENAIWATEISRWNVTMEEMLHG